MKTLVIGNGVSGKAAARFLKSRGVTVIVADKKPSEGILSDSEDLPLDEISQVIVSPGISPTHPLVLRAKEKQIEVIGEIELAFRFLKNRCFAITGSNGKTTTVLLTVHILNSCGIPAKALGNVGSPLTEYLIHAESKEIIILELSSFQLETLFAKAIDLAVVLNITPNHLDRHPSMLEYAKAKARIQSGLKKGGECFVSQDVKNEFKDLFPNAKEIEKELAPNFELNYTQLEMPSKQSVQTAYLLCKRCGVTDDDFLRSLQTYKRDAHRIEWVAKINGVSYYNDSKSSNIHSVMHAVERVGGQIVLIVGGVHKGSSYKPWIEKFKDKVRLVICYGKAAPVIEFELGEHFPLQRVDPFNGAVQLAMNEARSGETVLLSPGCSSYDQFDNYEMRGQEFKRLVRGNDES